MIYSYRIEQAIRAAAVLHDGQARKGPAPYPYITHLFAVAILLADYTADEDTIIAGLLHDTLEDTDYTPDELEADFGSQVRTIVEGVTEALRAERSKFTFEERIDRYFDALEKAPPESLLVSAADKIHNMRSIVEEYHDKPELFRKHFSHDIDTMIAKYERLKSALTERLENDIMKEFAHVHELFTQFLATLQNHHEPEKHDSETTP